MKQSNTAISRQKESPIVRNNIKIVSLFFIGIFVLKFYDEWSQLPDMFSYIMSKWDLETVLWLLSLVVLPLGIVLFYIKKPFGWFLLIVYAIHAAVINIGAFISLISRETSISRFKNGPAILLVIAYVLISLFFLTIIIMLCNRNIRAVYGINNRTMIWILIITTLLTCLELSQHEFFLTL